MKVDRSRLYGSSKKIVRDAKGNECVLSNLYNGDRILPKGSISQVLVDSEGLFVSNRLWLVLIQITSRLKKQLYFQMTINVKVDLDEFLSVNVKSIYQLVIEEDDKEKWNTLFANDEIYHFVFNYREDYGDDAYLISNGDDLFITVGKKNDFEFLEQSNIVIDDEEEKKLMMN